MNYIKTQQIKNNCLLFGSNGILYKYKQNTTRKNKNNDSVVKSFFISLNTKHDM